MVGQVGNHFMQIVILCETLNRYRFFYRMVPALTNSKHRFIFLSNRLSIVLAAKKDGNVCALIRNYRKSPKANSLIEDFDDQESCKKMAIHIESSVFSLIKIYSVDAFFFWNGSSSLACTICDIAVRCDCKTLFFEISNFPGKLFVDPQGVNVQSWFAENYEDITSLAYDSSKFETWCSDYLAKKLADHQVPQALISTKFNWFYLLDVIGFCLFSAPYTEKPDIIRRTYRFLCSKKVYYHYDNFEPEMNGGYVFFPLQVSTDSQLLVNSDIDNLNALYLASQIARNEGKLLVVKPHPAEGDRAYVARLTLLRSKLGFLFVDDNTFKLIKFSSRVVTINSTVGMEAMLLDKPVTVLGRAMYEKFSKADLMYYLQEYLIEVDFFDNVPISKNQFNAIIQRISIGVSSKL